MVRPAGWSSCGSSPTVLPSRRGRDIIGRQLGVTFESKLTRLGMIAKHMDVTARLNPVDALEHVITGRIAGAGWHARLIHRRQIGKRHRHAEQGIEGSITGKGEIPL